MNRTISIIACVFALLAVILAAMGAHLLKDLLPPEDFISFLIIGGVIVLAILMFLALLFKADKIVDLLNLDKGFDDEIIHLENFVGKNLIKISLIIIGGLMLLNNLSKFLTQCFFVFKSTVEKKNGWIYGYVQF